MQRNKRGRPRKGQEPSRDHVLRRRICALHKKGHPARVICECIDYRLGLSRVRDIYTEDIYGRRREG